MAAHAQTRPEHTERDTERERERRGSREAARRSEGKCAVVAEAAGIFCCL
jgi:hypothetical protein